MQFCYAALGRAGGRYTTLLPYPQHLHTRKRVKPEWLLAPALLGRRIGWPAPYNIEGDYELRVFGREWFLCAQQLLQTGKIRPHPMRLGEGTGFPAVLQGLDLLKRKIVSGEKLVYTITHDSLYH